MMHRARCALLLWLLPNMVASAAPQSRYMKEILEGRCYFAPPTVEQDRDACPSLVASLMNVLEGQVDANLSSDSFAEYLAQADFSSAPDQALFVLRLFGNESFRLALPPSLVSPEDSPGGALLDGLTFCGVDQRDNCSIETSNAYWQFWEAGTFRLEH